MQPIAAGVLLLACTGLVSCGDRPAPASEGAAMPATSSAPAPAVPRTRPAAWYKEQGRAIATQAFELLSTNLVQAMEAGGVTNALPVCSEKAVPLTATIADTNQVSLQRLTHKPRNPDNQASPDELALIQQFQAAVAAGQPPAPVLVTNRNDRISFYAPIVINNPVCLQCHGDPSQDIPPDALALIRSLYPQDQATGFKMNDVRGIWRVTW